MPYSGTGSYSVVDRGDSTVDLSAGLNADGTLVFTGGIYAVGETLAAGVNVSSAAPVTGRIRLTNDTDVTFAPSAGDAAGVYIGSNLNSGAGGGSPVAYGYLDILSGSTLTVAYTADGDLAGPNAYGTFFVGAGAGSLGQITVDGVGSQLISAGDANRISLGVSGGLGTLVVAAGGYAATLSLQVGSNGGLGQVYVSGAGSELVVSPVNGSYIDPAYAGQSGFATVGATDARGLLAVAGGGSARFENVDGQTDLPLLRFGRDNGSYGYGLVTGVGSRIEVNQFGEAGDDFPGGSVLTVGEGGQGVLQVENFGLVDVTGDSARLNVANGRYSFGQPDASNDESLLSITGGADVTVDSGAYGGTIEADGAFTSDGRGSTVTIGGGRETYGRIFVQGEGSTLTVTSDTDAVGDVATGQIIIGNLGAGVLEVREDGAVSARNIELGRSLITDGNVAAAGEGRLLVAAGGRVTVEGSAASAYRGIQAGEGAGAEGTIDVQGAGSLLTSEGGAGRIRIGAEGTGALNVSGGGAAQGLLLEAGVKAGGTGQIFVGGAGSSLLLSDAYGAFPQRNGQAGLLKLGGEAESTGLLTVSNGGAVEIRNAVNSFRDNSSAIVGDAFGSTGRITVTGQGSTLNLTHTGASNDTFGGASYNGASLVLGDAGGAGTVTATQGAEIALTGEAAQIRVGGGATDGQAALSTLAINGGAEVSASSIGTQSAAKVIVGDAADSRGQINLFGPDATLRVRSDNLDDLQAGGSIAYGATLVAGVEGDGQVIVSAGAEIRIEGANDAFPGLIVGEGLADSSADASGFVRVTGAGSQIVVAGTNTTGTHLTEFGEAGRIVVGRHDGAHGALVIETGGAVRNAANNSATHIGLEAGSSGVIRLSGSDAVLTAGTLLTVGANIDAGTVDGAGLPQIFAASGGTGLLEIGTDTRVVAGDIVVGNTGTLAGDGSLVGDLTLHGIIRPGDLGGVAGDIGRLFHVGAFDVSAGAAFVFDIGGFGAGQADQIRTSSNIATSLSEASFQIDLADGVTFGTESLTLISTDGLVEAFDVAVDASDGTRLRLTGVDGVGVVLSLLDQVLNGGNGADQQIGGIGNDLLLSSLGADLLDGRAGVDTADFASSSLGVTVNLGNGRASGGHAEGDTVVSVENLTGSNFEDRLTGSDDANTLDGGARDDVLSGAGGDDRLIGGTGQDRLNGGAGNDLIEGGSGSNTLNGGAGDDTLFGGDVPDVISGHGGDDTLFGGSGVDTLSGGSGDDTLIGGNLSDTLDGGAGVDDLSGQSGNDRLIGRGGDDVLTGGGGNDVLLGDAGDDILEGGAGRDVLSGGNGADRFVYRSLEDIGAGASTRDVIFDFRSGQDLIDLAAIDADAVLGDDQAFQFIGTSAFSGQARELSTTQINVDNMTLVRGDIDGDGVADFQLELSGLLTLDAGDFIL